MSGQERTSKWERIEKTFFSLNSLSLCLSQELLWVNTILPTMKLSGKLVVASGRFAFVSEHSPPLALVSTPTVAFVS